MIVNGFAECQLLSECMISSKPYMDDLKSQRYDNFETFQL